MFLFFSNAITFSPCLPFTKFQVKSCTFSFHIFSFLARCWKFCDACREMNEWKWERSCQGCQKWQRSRFGTATALWNHRAKKSNILLLGIGWFWFKPIQYNRRSIDKSSPPVITFMCATQRKPQIPMGKTIGGRKRESNERPDTFPFPQSILAIYQL